MQIIFMEELYILEAFSQLLRINNYEVFFEEIKDRHISLINISMTCFKNSVLNYKYNGLELTGIFFIIACSESDIESSGCCKLFQD